MLPYTECCYYILNVATIYWMLLLYTECCYHVLNVATIYWMLLLYTECCYYILNVHIIWSWVVFISLSKSSYWTNALFAFFVWLKNKCQELLHIVEAESLKQNLSSRVGRHTNIKLCTQWGVNIKVTASGEEMNPSKNLQ